MYNVQKWLKISSAQKQTSYPYFIKYGNLLSAKFHIGSDFYTDFAGLSDEIWIDWVCTVGGSKPIPISRGNFSKDRISFLAIFSKTGTHF